MGATAGIITCSIGTSSGPIGTAPFHGRRNKQYCLCVSLDDTGVRLATSYTQNPSSYRPKENTMATEPAFMTKDGVAMWCGRRDISLTVVMRHDKGPTILPNES